MRGGGRWAWLVAIAASVSLVAQEKPAAGPQAYLRSALKFSDGDLSNLERGRAVVKTLPQVDKREVITAGAIRIQAPSPRFVAQFRTLEGFKTSQFVRQIDRFSSTPVAGDLDPLVLDPDDLDDLRSCTAGDCGIRMEAADIGRFAEIDWKAADAAARASSLYKAMLFRYLTNFQAGGLSRLPIYSDQEEPLALGEELKQLLSLPSPLDQAPALHQYLESFPGGALPQTEHFYYWSKEAFGFKPVIGLYLVVMHTSAAGDVFIVTTQIYASHYMDGQFSLSVVMPDGEGESFDWLYFNRARIGRLDSFLGTLSRSIVQRRTRNGLSRSMTQTRERMEKRDGASH